MSQSLVSKPSGPFYVATGQYWEDPRNLHALRLILIVLGVPLVIFAVYKLYSHIFAYRHAQVQDIEAQISGVHPLIVKDLSKPPPAHTSIHEKGNQDLRTLLCQPPLINYKRTSSSGKRLSALRPLCLKQSGPMMPSSSQKSNAQHSVLPAQRLPAVWLEGLKLTPNVPMFPFGIDDEGTFSAAHIGSLKTVKAFGFHKTVPSSRMAAADIFVEIDLNVTKSASKGASSIKAAIPRILSVFKPASNKTRGKENSASTRF